MGDPNHGKITDEAMAMVAYQNPGFNNNQIAKKVAELGVVKHPQTAYKRLTKSAYLKRDIDEIHAHQDQEFTRELVPPAFKVVKKALNNKELDDKEKFPYAKLVMDKWKDTRVPNISVNKVEYQQLQVYQTIINDNLPD